MILQLAIPKVFVKQLQLLSYKDPNLCILPNRNGKSNKSLLNGTANVEGADGWEDSEERIWMVCVK